MKKSKTKINKVFVLLCHSEKYDSSSIDRIYWDKEKADKIAERLNKDADYWYEEWRVEEHKVR